MGRYCTTTPEVPETTVIKIEKKAPAKCNVFTFSE
jgi:hypothetical protein